MKIFRGAAIKIEFDNSEEVKETKKLLTRTSKHYEKAERTKKGRGKYVDGKWCRASQNITYYIETKSPDGKRLFFAPSGVFHFLKKKFPGVVVEDKTVSPAENIGFLDEVRAGLTLRRFQQEAIETSKKFDQGIFEVPTGGGKTILGLSLIDTHKMKTLVICDSTEIFNQWVNNVKTMFGFKPGIVKASKFDITPPVVIAMTQTLINRPEMKQQSKMFGLLIIDECQQIGPGTYFNIPNAPIYNSMGTVSQWFSCKKKYGLTDGAIRSDGQNVAIKYAIGPIIYKTNYDVLEKEDCVIKPNLVVRQTEFRTDLTTEDYPKIVWQMIRDEARNEMIVKDLLKEENHYCLILANSRNYVRMLAGMLIENNPELNKKIVVLTSSTPAKKREKAIEAIRNKKINYLFCTALADKGMDIPSLDRLFMVFPGRFEGRKRQQLGRVVRFQDCKEAVVYEYVDCHVPLLESQFKNRLDLVYSARCILDFTDNYVEAMCESSKVCSPQKKPGLVLSFSL